MSDVAVAPNAAPPDVPSSASEVAIETNPVSLPTPVGSQAPEAPAGDVKGSEHRPQSRREAIQAAFERARTPQPVKPKSAPRPSPGPAEAKPGHNQPPEAVEAIDAEAEKAESKSLPRGERGRFAPRGPQDAQSPPAEARDGREPPSGPSRVLPKHAPYRDPLPRMSELAKAEWAQTPESVRADVHRIEKEMFSATQFYQAGHEAMKPLWNFHRLAQSQGTTLERALSNYVSLEQKIRQDPIGGLDVIVNNLNLKAPNGQRLGLRDVAYHVLTQTPDQLRVMQQGNQQTAAAQQIGDLHQQIEGLKNVLYQMHTRQQFGQSRAAVDQFAAEHPRFDELGDLIERELRLGFDLDTAYRRAELLRPATQAAQTRDTAAQTRTVDRSISGAPAGPTNGTGRRNPDRPVSRREAVQNAISRVKGSL